MRASGVVSEVFEREWEGRDGTVVLHSFKLDGDNRYYRTGTTPLVREGDSIAFTADGKGNVDTDSLEKGVDAPRQAPRQQNATQAYRRPGGGGGKSWGGKKASDRDGYWERKEARDQEIVEPRITWSSAQSDAVVLVTAALQHDLLSFGNANKGARLGLLLDYVDQVTARFATQRFNAAELLKDAMVSEEATSRSKNEGDDDLE